MSTTCMFQVQKKEKDFCKQSSNVLGRLQVKKRNNQTKPIHVTILSKNSKKFPPEQNKKGYLWLAVTLSQTFSQFFVLNYAFCGFDKKFTILIQMVRIGIVKVNIILALGKAPNT